MIIVGAKESQASDIATLIMEAMGHECCQYFAGERHTLEDFHTLLTNLVIRDDSQYSYLNTLVALDEEDTIMGICTAYDGANLHELRKVFIKEAKEAFGKDHSGIPDETQAGEYYVDSLCVDHRFRGQGIASALLHATIQKAFDMGFSYVGLLVDKENPSAERLYTRLGFRYVDDNSWGGHPMRHLVINSSREEVESNSVGGHIQDTH